LILYTNNQGTKVVDYNKKNLSFYIFFKKQQEIMFLNKIEMETISKSTLTFLTSLEKNNNREWFHSNRKIYDPAKAEFEVFIQAVINRITDFEPILKGLEANSCIFRINRDIRFSHNKSPYKSNFGAFIVKGGKKNGDKYAGYYIHVEPGKSFIAGGAYVPPAPWLSAIREKIDDEPRKFLKLINDRDFKKYFGKLDGEKLKSAPRGYQADNPNLDLLKFKSYLVMHYVTDKEITGPSYLEHVIMVAKAMKPLNDFLNDY
jgi:uncharacterized protein (TIGR02453 family)